MKPNQFTELVKLTDGTEPQKAILIAFYLFRVREVPELELTDLCKAMVDFGLSSPNKTRLRKNPVFSRAFMKGTGSSIKLRLKTIEELDKQFPEMMIKSEEIITDETILPESVYNDTRGYLELVAQQVNACYHYNLFDGCAMMMRRLMEMLLVLSYRALGKEDEIKSLGGGYHSLSTIITHTIQNKALGLPKGTLDTLDSIRELGNYSAHRVEYNCRQVDISRLKMSYRVCIEELMYKSGVKK